MRIFKLCLLSVLLFGSAFEAHAQVMLDLKISRRLYIIYEPLIVTVTIKNRTGRELHLEDKNGHQWFGFDIVRQDGTPIAPNNTGYTLKPLTLGVGETITRKLNISPLYSLHEFGMHRIRATVFVAETGDYFVSPQRQVDITEGKVLWTDIVGVPDKRETRKISLLSHRIPQGNRLYIRIEDEGAGMIYCTTKIGRLLSYGQPKVKFDQNNEVHVIHKTSPGMYGYYHFGLNGKLVQSGTYIKVDKSFPKLRHASDGSVVIKGGRIHAPLAESVDNPRPKLSDRPRRNAL